MQLQDLVVPFAELFAGRTDVFAEAVPHRSNPNKVQYVKVDRDITPDDYIKHLKGTSLGIGIYPIVGGKVKWMAVDFDGPEGTEFSQVLDEAKVEQYKLERIGLQTYLERSRSGKGIHLWVFLDDWLDAELARGLLVNTLAFTSESFDRVYPVQIDTRKGGYGNLLALPFHGASVKKGNSLFIDPEGNPLSRSEFVTGVQKNSAEFVRTLAQETKPKSTSKVYSAGYDPDAAVRPAPIEGVLKLISPFGCPFMRYAWENRRILKEPMWYAAIGQATCFKGGRDFAHLLSKDYPRYDPKEVDDKFDHALQSPPVSYKYLKDKFPQVPLDNIRFRFPFEAANQTLAELVTNTSEQMEVLGSFAEDLDYIRRLNDGSLSSGVTWGIPGLDEISLLRPSELTIVGGHPSMGKSWLLTAGFLGQAAAGVTPFVFSPETARTPLRQRMIANIAQVELMALRGERTPSLTQDEFKRIEGATRHLEGLKAYTDYTSTSAENVISQVERSLLKHRIALDSPYVIWFDYLQFGQRQAGEDDRERISRMAGEFKIIAKVLEHPVVALSQLIRTEEGSEKPSMNWFAGSSSIERNMDTGLILTGQRLFGDYAPRTITGVKQREGRANLTKDFTLQQGYGNWRPIIANSHPERKNLLGEIGELGNDSPL